MKRISRKIFVSGSSYIISLPKEWIRSNSLKAGDVVFCDIGKDSLTIRPRIEKVSVREARIENEVDSKMLLKKIISYYLAGYETIRINVNEKTRKAVYDATNLLIGAEILEDDGNEIWMEIFVDERRFRINDLLEKMSNTVISMMRDLIKNLTEINQMSLDGIIQRENEVDKLYFLILRILKSSIRYADILEIVDLTPLEILGTRTVIKNIERVGDHFYVMTESLKEANVPIPILENPAEKSLQVFKYAINSFFKKDENLARGVFELIDSFSLPNFETENIKEIALFLKLSDGLLRTIGYSEDIAEITLNLATP